MQKRYENNWIGKKGFVSEVIDNIVGNEGTFERAEYVHNMYGEYIDLYHNGHVACRIDVTADSVSALIRDFCKQFTHCVEKIINGETR